MNFSTKILFDGRPKKQLLIWCCWLAGMLFVAAGYEAGNAVDFGLMPTVASLPYTPDTTPISSYFPTPAFPFALFPKLFSAR